MLCKSLPEAVLQEGWALQRWGVPSNTLGLCGEQGDLQEIHWSKGFHCYQTLGANDGYIPRAEEIEAWKRKLAFTTLLIYNQRPDLNPVS